MGHGRTRDARTVADPCRGRTATARQRAHGRPVGRERTPEALRDARRTRPIQGRGRRPPAARGREVTDEDEYEEGCGYSWDHNLDKGEVVDGVRYQTCRECGAEVETQVES